MNSLKSLSAIKSIVFHQLQNQNISNQTRQTNADTWPFSKLKLFIKYSVRCSEVHQSQFDVLMQMSLLRMQVHTTENRW